MATDAVMEVVIDEYLNGHGRVIAEEAERAGLELDLACALVEQESVGVNQFGADHPWAAEHPDEPPFYRVRVTAERVEQLLAYVEEHGYTESNGCGIVQLTWPTLIYEARSRGGAHRPRFQCQVGFEELRNAIERYGLRTGLGVYNGGPKYPNIAYAWDVLEKRNEWRRRLKSAT